jgi:ABC-type lipoprotein export system ATPase subunit
MKATLAFENVTQTFFQGNDTLTILRDISVVFEHGNSYAITGVSGSGKSTFLALLAGFEKPTQGHIYYQGHALNHFSEKELQKFLLSIIGFLFQHPYLHHEFTVIENVMLKGLIAGKSREECMHHAMTLLKRLNLTDKAYSLPAHLSGGEQQRVSFLRAIFLNPAFLIADEPTAHLDEATKMPLLNLLKEYQHEQGMGLIISSHDIDLVHDMSFIYRLHKGSLELVKESKIC